jgi:hypothetical protein
MAALDATEVLASLDSLRARVRVDKYAHWFPLVVFGLLTLASSFFYLSSTTLPAYCATTAQMSSCLVQERGVPLGGALGVGLPPFGVTRWLSVYWAVALLVGFALTVAFYHRRALLVGVRTRVWPALAFGVSLLAVVLLVNGAVPVVSTGGTIAGDLWVRGTGSLLILAAVLAVLAVIQRSTVFLVYSVGFVGLTVLSSLYDFLNVFGRVGLGGAFETNASSVPNLLVPGAYLLVGGLAFWLGGRSARRAPVASRAS